MEPPSYVQVPEYATLIMEQDSSPLPPNGVSPRGLSTASFPPIHSKSQADSTASPFSKQNITNLLLNQVVASLPGPLPNQPRKTTQGQQTLLSMRDPLSIPITSVNFRRFISKCGFIFWLQDRVEEIVMWKRGWKYTSAWMSGYAFFCFYPRMTLLIPHASLLFILFTTYQRRYPNELDQKNLDAPPVPAFVTQPGEGTPDWFANLQAIQNLMGIVSDGYDVAVPLLSHLTWTNSTTSPLFLITFLTFFGLIPLLGFIPLRPLFLFVGLFPFVAAHPLVLSVLPGLVKPLIPHLKVTAQKAINDDKLLEKHWGSTMIEVCVWENERWNSTQGWKSGNLRIGERRPWTRGQDGWSRVVEGSPFDGDVRSNLTFALPEGWEFVETEDWAIDFVGGWTQLGADEDGWVYTNDAWLDPRPHERPEWKALGMTRRRRWARRIYFRHS